MFSDLKTSTLPLDFLSEPAKNPTVRAIDFSKTDLPENEGLYAVIIDNVLSPDECRVLVGAAEAHSSDTWERAMVNVGGGSQVMHEDSRKCGRIIWDSHQATAKLWTRIQHLLPEVQTLDDHPRITSNSKDSWKVTRLNERMRFLKYTTGEYFKPHCDGMYETPDRRERTYLTLHLYLNDSQNQLVDDEPLVGGATTFWSRDMKRRLDVKPKMGSVLIFQQRLLIHSGDDVIKGTKLTMRTELMYEKGPTLQASKTRNLAGR